MTSLRDAAQQALEAMEIAEVDPHSSDAVYKAITALRAVLEGPVQEPVAWLRVIDGRLAINDGGNFGKEWTPLYTAPRKPLAEWQINDLIADIDPEDVCAWSFRQGVYAAEKHHGVKP